MPSRKVLELLAEYLEKHPNIRLGQAVVDFTPPHSMPFYVSDDALALSIQAFLFREKQYEQAAAERDQRLVVDERA